VEPAVAIYDIPQVSSLDLGGEFLEYGIKGYKWGFLVFGLDGKVAVDVGGILRFEQFKCVDDGLFEWRNNPG
jgi:hypothetical protein